MLDPAKFDILMRVEIKLAHELAAQSREARERSKRVIAETNEILARSLSRKRRVEGSSDLLEPRRIA